MAVATRDTFDYIFQDAGADNIDCGWFAGYVMSLGSTTAQFSQEDVYQARDGFRKGPPIGGPGTEMGHSLSLEQATDYLASLGLTGYRVYGVTDLNLRTLTVAGFRRLLQCILRPPIERSGAMFAINNLTHWISVPGGATENQVVYYDPDMNAKMGSGVNPLEHVSHFLGTSHCLNIVSRPLPDEFLKF